MRRMVSEWYICIHIAWLAFQVWSQLEGGFVGILTYKSVSGLQHFRESVTFRNLSVECFQSSFVVSGDLYIFFFCSSHSDTFQVSGGTCHWSIQTSDPCCTMLNGAPFLSTVLNILDIPCQFPLVKILLGMFPYQMVNGLLSLHLTLWMLMYCTDKASLHWSVRW